MNTINALMDVNTVKLFEESEVFEWRFFLGRQLQLGPNDGANVFCCVLMLACNGKVIDLTQEENGVSVNDCTIDIARVSS